MNIVYKLKVDLYSETVPNPAFHIPVPRAGHRQANCNGVFQLALPGHHKRCLSNPPSSTRAASDLSTEVGGGSAAAEPVGHLPPGARIVLGR